MTVVEAYHSRVTKRAVWRVSQLFGKMPGCIGVMDWQDLRQAAGLELVKIGDGLAEMPEELLYTRLYRRLVDVARSTTTLSRSQVRALFSGAAFPMQHVPLEWVEGKGDWGQRGEK